MSSNKRDAILLVTMVVTMTSTVLLLTKTAQCIAQKVKKANQNRKEDGYAKQK